MDEQARYERARRRVQAMRGFYSHLAVYIVVNVGLVLINLLTSPGALWFYWPLLGWGAGLAAHAFAVFGIGTWFGRNWEEQQIRKIMERGEE